MANSAAGSPFRVGVIGFGAAGSLFHSPFIAATPGLRLTTIVTGDRARAEQAQAEYPGVVVRSTADELWAAADVDLVVVAAPNVAHVPLAARAIEAGIPVVVDKPLAVTSIEARHLAALARDKGVPLTVYQNRRFDGDFQTLAGFVRDGSIGDPIRFESRFERWRLQPKPGWRESGDPSAGGGLLMDLGSHLIDQATHLFGPVATVYAELDRRRPGVAVDDDAFVALTHRSGVRSHLWMSVLASQLGPRFRLLGSRASFVKFGMDPQEDALRVGQRPASADAWGTDAEECWGSLGALDALQRVRTEAGNYGRFYVAVEQALRTGGAMPVDPEEACRTLEIIEAARDAAESRRLVTID